MNRRILVGLIGLVIIVGVALLSWQPWRMSNDTSVPAPVADVARVAPIVANDTTGNIIVVREGNPPLALTSDAGASVQYLQITPAPDGEQVVYVAVERARSRLLVQKLDGGAPRTVFESSELRPFYIYWSPDSRQIAFLASDQTMHLYLVPADGSSAAREIREGNPSYFAWTADSTRLILHTGGLAPRGSIATYTLDGAKLDVADAAPGNFQAPAWNADNSARFVVLSDGTRNRLVRETGAVQQDLSPRTLEAIIFSRSPDGSQLAYMMLGDTSRSPIQVVAANGGDARALPPVLPLAFFWSPDGSRLATLVVEPRGIGPSGAAGVVFVAQTAPMRLHWEVTTLADNAHQRFAAFEPSDEFLNLLPYFDQYALSLNLWSPDSTRLVYGTADGVHTLHISDGSTTKISDGTQGFWAK